MQVFLDSSVILAACGSSTGASRAIFDLSKRTFWLLITSQYAIDEVEKNVAGLGPDATETWRLLKDRVRIVESVFAIDKPTVFLKTKDRPILFAAYAWANVLITLDVADFQHKLGDWFYHVDIETPGSFLRRERQAGRIPEES